MMVEIRQTSYMITTSLAGLERESRVLINTLSNQVKGKDGTVQKALLWYHLFYLKEGDLFGRKMENCFKRIFK